jgi:transposase
MRFVAPLSRAQVGELEGLRRAGRSHRLRQRAHAVLLSARGYTLDQAADVLAVDRDAISRWLSRWEAGGAAALADAPKSGRPRKLAAPEEATLTAAASASPASPRWELAKKGTWTPAGRR